MTADAAAYDRLAAIFPLDMEGGERELVVLIERLTREEVGTFMNSAGSPDVDRFQRMLGELGHLGSMRYPFAGGTITLHIKTREPRRAWQALRDSLDPALLARVTAAHRPVAVTRFEVLFPANCRCRGRPRQRRSPGAPRHRPVLGSSGRRDRRARGGRQSRAELQAKGPEHRLDEGVCWQEGRLEHRLLV